MSDGELIARALMQTAEVVMLKLGWVHAVNGAIDAVSRSNELIMDELRRREAERKGS